MSSTANEEARVPLDARLLFQAAMLIFVITVVIGILNGLRVFTFERDQLLTHVHAGTIGWITMGVLATCVWLFSPPGPEQRSYIRPFSWLMAVCTPLYVLAFWSGNFFARAVFGLPVLLSIVVFLIWIAGQTRRVRLTLPRLTVLLAIITLVIGSTIGVIVQVQFATGQQLLPAGAIGGHAGAQVVGYLILIGMAITEWRLLPEPPRLPRLGVAQVALPFFGGLLVSLGAMIGSQELLGAFIPFELVAIGFYLWRLGPRLARISWLENGSARHFGVMVPFLVANVVLLVWLISGVVSGVWSDFALIPVWLTFAFDHAMFIGVMSNGLFGLLFEATQARRQVWSWAGHVLFWGMNLGMIGFVLSLLANTRELERIFTPIMGVSILLALLTYTIRLQSRPAPVEAPAPAA